MGSPGGWIYGGCAARGGRELLVPRKAELCLRCHGHPLVSLASSLPGQAGSDVSLCGVQKARWALGHLSLLWGFQQQAAPDPRCWRFSHGQGCPGLCGCGHWELELLPQECGLSASQASRPSLAF